MALPNSTDNTTPVGSDAPSTLDNQLRDLKTFLEDVLGIPNATAISAAGLNFVAAGMDRILLQDAAANPTAAGRLQRNAANLLFHDGTAARTIVWTAIAQTLTDKTLTSPIIGTQITLDQTTADYTLTWANPAAARAISVPDPLGTDVFVFRDMTQTLINKTLTTPIISTISNTGTVTLPTSTDTLVGRATTDTLTNKTLLAPSNTVSGVLDRDVTINDVVNTAVETTVYSFSVPGGTLGTDRALRLTLIGDVLNNTGPSRTFTVRVKFGATKIFSNGSWTVSSDTRRRGIYLTVDLSAANATNAQVSWGRFATGPIDTVDGNSAEGALMQTAISEAVIPHTSIAEDSTTAKTLEVTFQNSAADANLSFRALAVILEVLR